MQWGTSRLSLMAAIQLGMSSMRCLSHLLVPCMSIQRRMCALSLTIRIHGMYTLKRYGYGSCPRTPWHCCSFQQRRITGRLNRLVM
eukprot:4875376-Ditylum_brightwellii.AAC.1